MICIDNVVYALALEMNMPKYKSWLYQPKQLSSWPIQIYMSCVCLFSGLISYLPSHSSRSIGFLAFLRHKLLTLCSLFSLSYFLNCSVVAIQPALLFYPDLLSNATHHRKCSRSWSQGTIHLQSLIVIFIALSSLVVKVKSSTSLSTGWFPVFSRMSLIKAVTFSIFCSVVSATAMKISGTYEIFHKCSKWLNEEVNEQMHGL